MSPTPVVPATMRAAVLTAQGGPETLVVRDDVPVPVPGRHEVLIRVSACGVNNTDINTRLGWYGRAATDDAHAIDAPDVRSDDANAVGSNVGLPRIQGVDPCGSVVDVGSAVDPDLIGSRVVVDPCIRDRDRPDDRDLVEYLGSERDGGFAEFCAVPDSNVHVVTSEVDDIALAALACSWSTAAHMLERVRLAAGQRIAITGASGGVGSALVGLATLRGADVTAIARSDKHPVVAELGATHLVARDVDDVPGAAVATAGAAFDVVADVVGGADVGGWLDSLRRGGRYVTSGAVGGPIVDVDLRTLYLKDLEMYGATIFGPRVFADLVELVNDGLVRPRVAATFPLEEIHEAQAMFQRREHVGKIVITLGPDRY